MKGGGKEKLAEPRDFQRNPFVIFGEPLAKGCFRGGCGVDVVAGGVIFIVMFFDVIGVSNAVVVCVVHVMGGGGGVMVIIVGCNA